MCSFAVTEAAQTGQFIAKKSDGWGTRQGPIADMAFGYPAI